MILAYVMFSWKTYIFMNKADTNDTFIPSVCQFQYFFLQHISKSQKLATPHLQGKHEAGREAAITQRGAVTSDNRMTDIA